MVASHPYKLRLIEVDEFKSIESASLTLHPLSIVVGANSSGKTSLLQVILAISQAVRSSSSGARFPLNGEYARFGTFGETVRFRSAKEVAHQDTPRRIGMRMVIADSEDAGVLRYENVWGEVTEDERVYIDWSFGLVSDGNSESDTAKLDAIQLFCYQQAADGERQGILRYDLEDLADIAPDDELLRFPLLDPGRRTFSSERILTSTDGSYLEVEDSADRVISRCNAVRLRGPLPDNLYRLSTFADAIGQHWWNGAKLAVAMQSSTDSSGEPERAPVSDQTSSEEQDIKVMVQSAAKAAEQLRDSWRERPDARRWSPPIAVEIQHHLLQEQFDRSQENPDRDSIERGLSTVSIETFLERLTEHLWDEDWAQEVGWSSLESFVRPGYSWSSYMIHHFFDRDVKYLGPLRKAPQVLYDPRLRDLDLGLSGEYTAAVLHANASHQVVPIDGASGASRVSLESAVNYWLHRLGLASAALLEDRGRLGIGLQITLIDSNQTRDLTAVGVGVSQILPVLVLCLLSEPGDLVILEQPELHLHPALQQQLGDFLLDCAGSGRQLVVETHSEHVVNRVRRRVADPSGSSEGMVGLIFAEKIDGVTKFRESSINRYGGSEGQWPEGFFDVSAREAQALVSASLTKRVREAEDPPSENAKA